MERNDELGLDLAPFRSYDPAIGRWLQVDPKAESFAPMSPYTGMGNNPISIIDPLGDSIDVFAPDGSFLYTYDDGKEEVTGYYFQNCDDCSEDGNGEASYSGGVAFRYNDVKEDRWKALYGMFSFSVVSDSDFDNMVSEGVDAVGSVPIVSDYYAGREYGPLDCYAKSDSPIASNTLYIITSARGGTRAYNPNDLGNYLTGQS